MKNKRKKQWISWRNQRNVKGLCKRKNNANSEKEQVELVPAEFGVCPLSSSGSSSGFSSAQGPVGAEGRGVIWLLAAWHVPPSPASRGDFYRDLKGRPLGFPWESLFSLLGKLWLCSPNPAPPIFVCPSLFPIMYSFWWTSCLCQRRGQSV